MKKIKYIIIMVAISVICFGAAVYADNEDRPQFDDSTVLVVMKPQNNGIRLYSAQSASNSAYSIFDELGVTDIEKIATIPSENTSKGAISLFSVSAVNGDKDVLKLTLPENSEDKVLEAVDILNNSGTVEYAQPDYYYYLDAIPNDPRYSQTDRTTGLPQQYNLKKINAEAVWDMNIDCSGVAVAIIDSGMMTTHADLKDNLCKDENSNFLGYDFVNKTSNLTSGYWHGTHVAGIIGASTNNGIGISSLAGNVKLAPLQIFTDTGLARSSAILPAIQYVKEKKFPIANCSWGGNTYDELVKTTMESSADTLFVVAAGNSGDDIDDKLYYPAGYDIDNILTVAATDENDDLAKFYDLDNGSYVGESSYGANTVDIAAPGKGIWSTYNNGGYASSQGTSQAAPLVASAAAVIKAKYPDLSPVEIKQAIMDGADTVSTLEGKINGARRLNAFEALKIAGSPYTVTWKNDDGNTIDTTYVDYKVIPSHIDPEKADSEEFSYTFSGWYPEIGEVTDDVTYTATFETTKIAAKITWKNDDGTVIDSEYVKLGELPSHDAPEKESDEQYDYIFTGWSPEIVPAEEDIEYTAQFQPISQSMPREPIHVIDKFASKFRIESTQIDSDALLILIIPDEDNTDELPSLSAYVPEYNADGELVKIQMIDFKNSVAEIKPEADKQCRLLIWTERNEPVIMPIDDISAYMNIPSQL